MINPTLDKLSQYHESRPVEVGAINRRDGSGQGLILGVHETPLPSNIFPMGWTKRGLREWVAQWLSSMGEERGMVWCLI